MKYYSCSYSGYGKRGKIFWGRYCCNGRSGADGSSDFKDHSGDRKWLHGF